jgi:hypothetical protein
MLDLFVIFTSSGIVLWSYHDQQQSSGNPINGLIQDRIIEVSLSDTSSAISRLHCHLGANRATKVLRMHTFTMIANTFDTLGIMFVG